ncbi:hypothetical protein [Cohnella soli]|uniref:Oligosaccharide repeat unit polymerase n=1 Tax=Cohnella soli TaxID=425005 RepID=A0ABW0HVF4_9BACL
MLRLYMMFIFFLLNGALCYANTESWPQSGMMMAVFMLNLVCVTIGFYRAMSVKTLNLDTIIWIFVYMFFFIAPVIQLQAGPLFPNTMPIEPGDVIRAGIVVFVWNVVYMLFRSLHRPSARRENAIGGSGLEIIGSRVRVLYFALSCGIFAMTIALFKLNYFFGAAEFGAVFANKSLLLLVNISFQGIVFANWLFAFDDRRRYRSLVARMKLLLASVILLNQLSPFNTSRFYIGFCVILVVYLFYFPRLKPSQFIWIMFTGLLFIFPFLNMFRYGFGGYEMPTAYHLMFDQLTELHFDAFSNLAATMRFTDLHGYSYGYQMLGVLFFFVPRDIWSGKPLSSGEAIGDFISGNYTLNFNNLSNPLPSEFMINFGWVGVAAGALLMALFVNRLESSVGKNRYTHALIAGFLFILLRGDLMNAFAYCFGTYCVMVLLPTGLSRFLDRAPRSSSSHSPRNGKENAGWTGSGIRPVTARANIRE